VIFATPCGAACASSLRASSSTSTPAWHVPISSVLYNCVRHGAAAQNRAGNPDFRAHLAGRVAWVEYAGPAGRAARLRDLFEKIIW